MAWNAPGQHFRKGISLVELFCKFKDDETVEKWFYSIRWPEGYQSALYWRIQIFLKGFECSAY